MIDSEIIFNKKDHTYFNKKGEQYISASTIVGVYKPPFDPDGSILIRKAEKEGVTPEELRKEWDRKRDDSCLQGNNFHEQAEFWVKNKKIKKADYKDVIKQLSKISFKGKLQAETVLSADSLKIAGTIDLIDIYKENEADIFDYKTNKALKYKSFYTKEKGYGKMLPPIDHLLDCNYIHYCLQQEIYGILLEENGYWVNEKTLLYVEPKTRILEKHPVAPLRNEAFAIINHYNKQKRLLTLAA